MWDHPSMEELLQRRPLIREQLQQRTVELSLWPVLPLDEQLKQRELMYVPERFEKQMEEIVDQLMARQLNNPENGGIIPFAR